MDKAFIIKCSEKFKTRKTEKLFQRFLHIIHSILKSFYFIQINNINNNNNKCSWFYNVLLVFQNQNPAQI